MAALDVDIDPEAAAAESSSVGPPSLPKVSSAPFLFAGCCLALSEPLLAYLHTLLPPSPSLVLSVGSGYGLLEALLLSEPYFLRIVGVEVQPSPNRYLPPTNHQSVAGTRFLEPLATEATAWLFIYPRRVGLVKEYLSECMGGNVEMIVWAGPKADWVDYKGCFAEAWDVQVKSADEVGGRAWELIAIASRNVH